MSGGIEIPGGPYEEGTWTPEIEGSISNFTSVTYTVQIGSYVRTGKLVTVSCRVAWSAASGGSGALFVVGAPFLADPTPQDQYTQPFMVNILYPNDSNVVVARRANGTDQFIFNRVQSDGGTGNIDVAAANSGAFAKDIRFRMSYEIAP